MHSTKNTRSVSGNQILHQFRTDFNHYAPRALKVLPKAGSPIPFVMNKSQQHVHDCIERQLEEEGRVRALIVKGRQQGISTYVEGRYLWKATMNQAIRAFVVANKGENTKGLFTMSKRFYNNLPKALQPELGACNGYEMNFPNLESGFRVSSAGSEEVGRGLTITHLHGSEVAFWEAGDSIIASLFQAVPNLNNTEVILESTAQGPVGIFHKLVSDALEGTNGYQVIFAPWFWEDTYRLPVPAGFELTREEREYMELYNLTIEQMVWRRATIAVSDEGLLTFRREYPATIEEAFEASVEDALWTRDMIRSISEREFERICEEYDEIETVIAFDPAGRTGSKNSDESGINVARLMSDEKVYILEDASGHYTPQAIVPTITNLYWRYDADRLTIETNGVGEWVPTTIKMEDKRVVIHEVRARKGKRLRAMPVAQAYQNRQVVHVRSKNKSLDLLEKEMCSWRQDSGWSPNRIDALVYAVTDLLELGDEKKKVAPYMWASFGE